MNKSIENMMKEHRQIELVLGALETMALRIGLGMAPERETIRKFACFFQKYADRWHHGKEEDQLFVTMHKFGFPMEAGPLAVMLYEHNEGRAHVRALAAVGALSGPLTPEELGRVQSHAEAFVPLLRSHIGKEDNILYPMAEQSIPAPDLEALDAACSDFEQSALTEGEFREILDAAAMLIAQFPPDPVKMAAASACAGCRGH
jgi:hemerythrin-like domain-containing protein